MRVVVTGANGFVGSHCLEALDGTKGVEAIAACRDASKLEAGFSGEARVGDLRDADYLDELVRDADVVVHAAAWTALWGYKARSDALFLKPSLDLIAAARRAGVKRFIFISTVSVADGKEAAASMSVGRKRAYWPHEANVARIEDRLREEAGEDFTPVVMRLGLFAGSRYALGLLPILVPRLKTHLVPWVAGGRTHMPIIDGRDIGAAVALAATAEGLSGYEAFNIVGPEVPLVRDVITHLHEKHGLPMPHFSVPFPAAFAFAWLMEKLDPLVPWEPLVTRSIVHLMEETGVDNARATERLGYVPRYHWKDSVDRQLAEMGERQTTAMSMARPLPDAATR